VLPAVKSGHVHDISAQFDNGLAIMARLLLDELAAAARLLARDVPPTSDAFRTTHRRRDGCPGGGGSLLVGLRAG